MAAHIEIVITCYIPSDGERTNFPLGIPFSFLLDGPTNIARLVQILFPQKIHQVGLIVLNGQIAEPTAEIKEGDRLEFYPPLEGG